ncbi:MAG: lycopene cyclase domain-containing protein [Daejeonella sp.]
MLYLYEPCAAIISLTLLILLSIICPIVLYNDIENMAFRVGIIPFEDHFYSMSMLLINILLFEYF